MTSNTSIWDHSPTIQATANEATVEVQLIAPLLSALDYSDADISAKHPVLFQRGRVGRPAEADFAIFDGTSRELGNCLFVVEAKRPNEPFDTAQAQAESYAMYLRALVYVVTDGMSLEVWQYRTTARSELVLKCNVSELGVSRAKIEALLGRANLKIYRDKVREPSIYNAAADVSAYEQAELARTTRNFETIVRTLSEAEVPNSQERTFSCDEVLNTSILGAVVYGHSGMGKSSVCHRLHQLALLQRQVTSGLRLPVEIFLPDLIRGPQSVVDFAFKRVSAHCPGLSRAIFNEMLLNQGVDFFCDAFDRIPESSRQTVETDLNLLLRDSPRSRLFVFSRSTSPPKLTIPSLHLQPLNANEQQQLQQAITTQRTGKSETGHIPDVAALLPPFLSRIANSPLIFSTIVDFYIDNRKLPTKLVELFEFWLDEALRHSEHSPTAYDRLVKALTVVAILTWSGPATVADVVKAFDDERLPPTELDTLAALGAVTYSSRNVDVEHEALADFLRARSVLTQLSNGESASIVANRLDRESFFPVLLAAMATDPMIQRALLMQFTPVGLSEYIEAIRYRGATIPAPKLLTHDEVVAHVMVEIADGFTAPAKMFFPTLLPAIVETETGERSSEVTAVGTVQADYTSINFRLNAVVEPAPRHADSVRGQSQRDIVNEGRQIGMELLHKALDTVIADAALAGGLVWHEERLMSRLRLMLHENFDVEPSLETAAQIAFWEQHRDTWIAVPSGYQVYRLSANDFLADLEELRRGGKEHLIAWWNRNSSIEWWRRDWDESDAAIEHFYLRTDAAYEEVVRANFSLVASDLRNFQVMPRAWEIIVAPRSPHSRRFDLTALWHPVSTQAEVNISVRRAEVDDGARHASERWFEDTTAQLSALGRRFTSIGYSSGIAPSFNGSSLVGRYDGKTAVLRAVCARLRREFDSMFNSIERFPQTTPPFD